CEAPGAGGTDNGIVWLAMMPIEERAERPAARISRHFVFLSIISVPSSVAAGRQPEFSPVMTRALLTHGQAGSLNHRPGPSAGSLLGGTGLRLPRGRIRQFL